MRAQLSEMRLKGKTALQELTDEITTTVDEVVEESTQLVMAGYKGTRGELPNAIRSDVKRLFGQIERGLTVEFRVEPQPNADDKDQQALQQLAETAKQLKFPTVSQEPLLLKSGEILEDPSDDGGVQVLSHTKKTTTHKTTDSRKETKDAKEQV